MSRTLWLNAAQTSESEAILHPATTDQVALALEFLEVSLPERQTTASRLKSLLVQQRTMPPETRQMIPCRRPLGLTVLLPWRLAAWLVRVLESPEHIVQDMQIRLSRWLSGPIEAQNDGDEKKQAVAQPSLLG